ncbi:hypothetical protein CRE_17280 [Caenorhabditis remanei]|uniref:Uncharacterized protein n=1 Tax=Caenorhabditis remanei TaxID=31234 RepID=E3MAI5_CAERE|nr:hypothetical protein CRE_17280 [Caenorhabditis remanei]
MYLFRNISRFQYGFLSNVCVLVHLSTLSRNIDCSSPIISLWTLFILTSERHLIVWITNFLFRN